MTDETEAPAKKPMGRKTKIALIAVAAWVFGYTFWSTATADGDTEHPDGISQGEAWVACKDAVREHLTHPDSADFALLSTDISEVSDGYSIVGTLKASNDFGAEDELGFTCRVHDDHTVEAHVS